MTPVLYGLVAVAAVTGTCLWIGRRLHRDGPLWTPGDAGDPHHPYQR